MTDTANAGRLDRDMNLAYSYAINCLLYENDTGPATLNIGSDDNPHEVDRSHAWQLAFAHFLLEDVDADWSRLHATADGIHSKITGRNAERGRTTSTTRRWHLRLVEPDNAAEADQYGSAWQRALDLCHVALGLIEQAGAVHDDTARQRLLEASKNNIQLSIGALGAHDEIH